MQKSKDDCLHTQEWWKKILRGTEEQSHKECGATDTTRDALGGHNSELV